jgi:hypothetical protein
MEAPRLDEIGFLIARIGPTAALIRSMAASISMDR